MLHKDGSSVPLRALDGVFVLLGYSFHVATFQQPAWWILQHSHLSSDTTFPPFNLPSTLLSIECSPGNPLDLPVFSLYCSQSDLYKTWTSSPFIELFLTFLALQMNIKILTWPEKPSLVNTHLPLAVILPHSPPSSLFLPQDFGNLHPDPFLFLLSFAFLILLFFGNLPAPTQLDQVPLLFASVNSFFPSEHLSQSVIKSSSVGFFD